MQGCMKKECEPQTTHKNLRQEDKDKVPYSGYDTLTFIRMNDSVQFTFCGTGWQRLEATKYLATDCNDKEILEMRKLVFQSPTFSSPITISQYINDVNNGVYFEVDFQSQLFKTGLLWSKNAVDTPTLTIQGKTYKDIHLISFDDALPKPKDFGCLYTWNDGIIKIYYKSGESWEIIK
jgi:hypothetical protein